MKDSEKEQTKLVANALDRASTACLTVGVLAPFAAALYNVSGTVSALQLFSSVVLYLAAATILHRAALDVLKGLDQ